MKLKESAITQQWRWACLSLNVREVDDRPVKPGSIYVITMSWRSEGPIMREWGKLSTRHSPHWSSPPQAALGTQPQSSTRGLPHLLQTSGSSHTARCCTGSDADWFFAALFSGHVSPRVKIFSPQPYPLTLCHHGSSLCWGQGPILCLTLHAKHHYLAWTLSLVFHCCVCMMVIICVLSEKSIFVISYAVYVSSLKRQRFTIVHSQLYNVLRVIKW